MTPSVKRFACIFLISNLLLGCASGPPMRQLPPVNTDVAAKLRERIERLEKVELPPPVKPAFPPPAELDCKPLSEPGAYLCKGDPARMGKGGGLFFAFDGSAQDLSRKLASERLLWEMVEVLRTRMDLRDQTMLALLDALETSLFMAEEYRAIAAIRGEEVDRMRHEKLMDRLVMLIPIIGLAAGVFFLGIK